MERPPLTNPEALARLRALLEACEVAGKAGNLPQMAAVGRLAYSLHNLPKKLLTDWRDGGLLILNPEWYQDHDPLDSVGLEVMYRVQSAEAGPAEQVISHAAELPEARVMLGTVEAFLNHLRGWWSFSYGVDIAATDSKVAALILRHYRHWLAGGGFPFTRFRDEVVQATGDEIWGRWADSFVQYV